MTWFFLIEYIVSFDFKGMKVTRLRASASPVWSSGSTLTLIGSRQDCLYIRIQSRNSVFSIFKPLKLKSCARYSTFQLVFQAFEIILGEAVPEYFLSRPRVAPLMTSVSMACLSVLLWLIYSNSQSWAWTANCNSPGDAYWLSPDLMRRFDSKISGRRRILKNCCIGNNSSIFPSMADFWSASVPH